MKTLKNKKGFTLIELLAVIVVLAIVMVLATTTVLPLMNDATKNAFVLEANNARDTASNIMTLISINSADDLNLGEGNTGDYYKSADGTKYCFSLKKLAETGLWKKNIEAVAPKDGKPEYEGKVIVTTEGVSSNSYTYHVKMHNKTLYVDKEGTVQESDAVTFGSQEGFACTATDVGAS